jgi:hypothetical protein
MIDSMSVKPGEITEIAPFSEEKRRRNMPRESEK